MSLNINSYNFKRLFITGVFRSGTSLLSSSLNAHPGIKVAWQPYWLFFKACRNKFYTEVLNQLDFDTNYPMGILIQKAEERSLFKNVFSLISFNEQELSSLCNQIRQYLCEDDAEINQNMKPSSLAPLLDDLVPGKAGAVFEQLLQKLVLFHFQAGSTNQYDFRTIGVKDVFCEEFIEPMMELDRTYALHVIRDPRAVVASRNYGQYARATGTKYPIRFIIKSWLRSAQYFEENENKPKYVMVRYEDMATSPQKVLSKICRLIGETYLPELVDFSSFKNSNGQQWQPNSSFDQKNEIYTDSVNRWQQILSMEEIALIEYHCGDQMRELGYNLFCTESVDISALKYREDENNISNWLKKYDFRIN